MDNTETVETKEIVVDANTVERKAIVFAVPTEFAIPRMGAMSKPDEMYIGETRRYIPGYVGRDVLRGIPLELERKIPAFSNKLGVSPNSPNWEEAVKTFWIEFMVQLPFAQFVKTQGVLGVRIEGARTLDAGYKIVGDLIYPYNLEDYIIYELMTKDGLNSEGEGEVATSAAKYESANNYKFFCVDQQEEDARKGKLRNNSMAVYLRIAELIADKENTEKLKHIVSLTSTEVSAIQALSISREEAIDNIMALSNTDPEKFLKIVNDKSLADKAFVRQLTEAGIITKTGNSYSHNDDPLGELADVVKLIKLPASDNLVRDFKKKLSAYRSLQGLT